MSRSDESDGLGRTRVNPAFIQQKEGYTFGGCRLLERIGEGSFGQVWRAEKNGAGLAIKILKGSKDSDETQRELKSLEALKALDHPYLLRTDKFWFDGDQLFIEMELADGGTLKDRLRAFKKAGQKGIPENELLKYFRETAQALDYLHAQRPPFLHRDIKPANILLVNGVAKLADFGLLRQVGGDHTNTQTKGGTLIYMAPESIKNYSFGVRTDLFSFAVTYAELRQGKLPFSGKTEYQVCDQIVQGTPDLNEVFQPDERRVLLKALEKDPDRRHISCGAFFEELDRAVERRKSTDQPIFLPLASEDARATDTPGSSRNTPIAPGREAARNDASKTDKDGEPAEVELPWISTRIPRARTRESTSAEGAGTPLHSSPAAETRKKPARDPHDKDLVQDPPGPGKGQTATAPEKARSTTIRPKPKGPPLAARLLFLLVMLAIPGGTLWFFLAPVPNADKEDKDIRKPTKETKGPGKVDESAVAQWSGAEESVLGRLLAGKEYDAARRLVRQKTSASSGLATDLHEKINKSVLASARAALDAGRPEEARKLLEENESFLIAKSKDFLEEIDAKAGFIKARDEAIKGLDQKQFRQTMTAIDAARKIFGTKFDPKDSVKLDDLYTSAKLGRRDSQQALLGELRKLADDRKYDLLKTRLYDSELDWPDSSELEGFSSEVARSLLAQAWKVLRQPNADLRECGRIVDVLDTFAGAKPPEHLVLAPAKDAAYKIDFDAVRSVVLAYEAKEPARTDTVDHLVKLVQKNKAHQELWQALARLEEGKGVFRFKNLTGLDEVAKSSRDESINKAFSQILAHALERLARDWEWSPHSGEAEKCLHWCDARIDRPNDWIKALQAECAIETGGGSNLNTLHAFADAGSYGAYVHALVLAKYKKKTEAADVLVVAFKKNPGELKPWKRGTKAVDVLRSATTSLRAKGSRSFPDEKASQKALVWLALERNLIEARVTKPASDPRFLEVLIDSAFVAAKSSGLSRISELAKDLETHGFTDAAKGKGYYWLARAYQSTGNAEKEMFESFDRSIELGDQLQDSPPKRVSRAAGEISLELAKTAKDEKRYRDAVSYCRKCQKYAIRLKTTDELEEAARLYSDAVDVQVGVAFARSAEEKLDVADMWRAAHKAFDQALPTKEKLEPFYVPVVNNLLYYASLENFPKEQREATVELGDIGLGLAEKMAQTPKESNGWWKDRKYECLRRLAAARYRYLNDRGSVIANNTFDEEINRVIKLYQAARSMNKETAGWKELTWKIGEVRGHAGVHHHEVGDNEKARAELQAAKSEIAEGRLSLNALKVRPKESPDLERLSAILKEIDRRLADINK